MHETLTKHENMYSIVYTALLSFAVSLLVSHRLVNTRIGVSNTKCASFTSLSFHSARSVYYDSSVGNYWSGLRMDDTHHQMFISVQSVNMARG